MKLSEKMSRLGTESAFKVLAQAQALEAKGKSVVHLEIGEPDFDTPKHVSEAAFQALQKGQTHYVNAQGIIPLRKEIAKLMEKTCGVPVDPDRVVVTPGAKPMTGTLPDMLPARTSTPMNAGMPSAAGLLFVTITSLSVAGNAFRVTVKSDGCPTWGVVTAIYWIPAAATTSVVSMWPLPGMMMLNRAEPGASV